MTATLTLYAFALDENGRLHGIANRRVRHPRGGTRTLRDRRLGVTWPNTTRGAKQAGEWCVRNSVKSHDRRSTEVAR